MLRRSFEAEPEPSSLPGRRQVGQVPEYWFQLVV